MTSPKGAVASDGFTLLEVVVAMGIAVFAIVTITNLFVYASHQVGLAREDTGSSLDAQDKLEELVLINRGRSELDPGYYSDTTTTGGLREWWIYQDNPAPGAKLIVVKVTPKGGSSPRAVTMAAIRAR